MCFLIVSIVVISIVGTFSHFLYDISGHKKWVGVFCAVNESTWEHVKIALMPTIIWCLVDGFIYGTNVNYFLAKSASLIVIIVLMPLMFYGYKAITKKDNLILDIILFYITIACSQFAFYFIIGLSPVGFVLQYISCIVMFVLFTCYLMLTFLPLKNFIFVDPISNKYGFDGHTEFLPKDKKIETTSKEKVVDDGNVTFNREKKSVAELYAELSDEQKNFYNTIKEYVLAKQYVRLSEAKDSVTILFGRSKLIKLRIRRKITEAVFFLTDSSFHQQVDDSTAKIKETATVIKVTSQKYLDVVLQTINFKHEALMQERTKRIEDKKARRRKSYKENR